ncbi:MAG: radical SAM protein [Myxococcales bacterium]|nr:radical SAM protein [Myxococcales bacterium]
MVFVRFAGCNLWSGREEDRASARCDFCDTDFIGGERLTAQEIAGRVIALAGPAWVCFTGGEPALQLDRALLLEVRGHGYKVAIETNGTLGLDTLRPLIDWLCMSPKTPDLVVRSGEELKLIYRGQEPAAIRAFEVLGFQQFFLQPEWGPRYDELLAGALQFLQEQPRWRLSLQVHKLLGLP